MEADRKTPRRSKRRDDAANVAGARYAVETADAPVVADVRAPAWNRSRRVISATAAARSFSELISRVCYKGETYVVEKGGRPMCELSPVESDRFTGADFLAILGTLPKPAEEFLAAVEEAARRQSTLEPSPWEK